MTSARDIHLNQDYLLLSALIRPTSLVSTDKIQKKCCFRTRLDGLIST